MKLHTYGKLRQLDLLIGVAYSMDIQKALMVVRDADKTTASPKTSRPSSV
ncbi:MAG: hypothetical protein U0787_19055 [Polyangia bacterium]